MNEDWTLQGPRLPWRERGGGWMEWKSVTQCAPKITFQFPRIFSPGKGGCGGCGLVFRVKGRKGSCSPPIPRAKGKGDRTRFCTPCTGGQISGAAGSQAGLSHTDGADPGHRGGARQSGGDRREDMKETRTSILHYACHLLLPSHIPGCVERRVTQLHRAADSGGGSFRLIVVYY